MTRELPRSRTSRHRGGSPARHSHSAARTLSDFPYTHAALVYESQADQLETVLLFIAHGLRGGDRCMYMVDDNSQADILDA